MSDQVGNPEDRFSHNEAQIGNHKIGTAFERSAMNCCGVRALPYLTSGSVQCLSGQSIVDFPDKEVSKKLFREHNVYNITLRTQCSNIFLTLLT